MLEKPTSFLLGSVGPKGSSSSFQRLQEYAVPHQTNVCPLLGTACDTGSSAFPAPPSGNLIRTTEMGDLNVGNEKFAFSFRGGPLFFEAQRTSIRASLSLLGSHSYLLSYSLPAWADIPPAPVSCLGALVAIPCSWALNCSLGILHSDVLRDHHPPSPSLTGLLQILDSLLTRDESS